MLKNKIVSMVVASLFTVSNVYAEGIAQEVGELQITAEALVSAVNANSTAISGNAADISSLADQVASIPSVVTYNFKDFSGNVSSKTFKLQGFNGGCGVTEQRTITRTVNGANTDLLVNRIRRLADGSICHHKNLNYVVTADARMLVSKENLSFSGALKSTDTLGKPIALLTSSMGEGKSFGNATGIKNLNVSTGVNALISVFANTTTAVGIEDVDVPAGSFSGCLKVHTVRNSDALGRFDRYSWHCPGLGEVKRTQIDPVTLEYRFWKLTSYTR